VQGLAEAFAAGADDPYASAKSNYMARLGTPERMSGMQTSLEVAEVIARALADEAPALRYQTSTWSSDFVATKLSDLSGAATVAMTSSWVRD